MTTDKVLKYIMTSTILFTSISATAATFSRADGNYEVLKEARTGPVLSPLPTKSITIYTHQFWNGSILTEITFACGAVAETKRFVYGKHDQKNVYSGSDSSNRWIVEEDLSRGCTRKTAFLISKKFVRFGHYQARFEVTVKCSDHKAFNADVFDLILR